MGGSKTYCIRHIPNRVLYITVHHRHNAETLPKRETAPISPLQPSTRETAQHLLFAQ